MEKRPTITTNNHLSVRRLAGLVLALGLASASVHAKTFEESYSVEPGGLLTVDTDSGSIHVHSHENAEVLINVEVTGPDEDRMDVSFDSNGTDVTVEGNVKRSGGWFSSTTISARFHITVPRNYSLKLNTAGGSIIIEDLVGDVDADTSGGSVSLASIDGEVDVRTSGGSISVDRVAGNIQAHSSGGSISVDEVKGTINAHTSGGSVTATLTEQPLADSKLSSSGGSIVARLAPGIAVDVYGRTSGGRVSSEFEIDGSIDKMRLKGKINGGGPKLDLNTSGGNVKIKSL